MCSAEIPIPKELSFLLCVLWSVESNEYLQRRGNTLQTRKANSTELCVDNVRARLLALKGTTLDWLQSSIAYLSRFTLFTFYVKMEEMEASGSTRGASLFFQKRLGCSHSSD